MYFEYTPNNKLLRPFIDKIWYSQSLNSNLDLQNIHPDGAADIIIIKNKSIIKAYACGVMTKSQQIPVDKDNTFWGIRFKPGMASFILGVPLHEITDQMIELDDLIKISTMAFDYSVENKTSFEDLFAPLISEKLYSLDNIKEKANLIRILSSAQFGDIDLLAKELLISRRTLHRYFKEYFGVSARDFHNIKRFINFNDAIINNPNLSQSDYAQLAGYYDQADMIKQIKKICGVTPKQLMSQSYNT